MHYRRGGYMNCKRDLKECILSKKKKEDVGINLDRS